MTTEEQEALLRREWNRYIAALHGVQAGVAIEIGPGAAHTDAAEAKHLRVGVNSAMLANSALTKLLIAKGVISEAEYFTAQADAAEEERRRYEERISDAMGTKVTLV